MFQRVVRAFADTVSVAFSKVLSFYGIDRSGVKRVVQNKKALSSKAISQHFFYFVVICIGSIHCDWSHSKLVTLKDFDAKTRRGEKECFQSIMFL